MRDAEVSGLEEVVAEMNHWNLPPTVTRSTRSDQVERGTFAATTPTVTRWYDPVSGTSPEEALTALAAALKTQGYDLTEYPPLAGEPSTAASWDGGCKYSKYCRMTIGLDSSGTRVEVWISPGT